MPKYTSVEAVKETIDFLKSEIKRLEDTAEEIESTVPRINPNMAMTAANIIRDAFYWEDTPEGHDFWDGVHDKLYEIARTKPARQFGGKDFKRAYETHEIASLE